MNSRRTVGFGSGLVAVLALAGAASVTRSGGHQCPATGGRGRGDVTRRTSRRSCSAAARTATAPTASAPMSLVTYEEVRPWARAIKQRTGIGPHAGVMPPWYIEKNIGIQQFKNDPSLSDDGDRQDRQVGRQRRAARQPRRHAAGHGLGRRHARGRIGTPDLDRQDARTSIVKANAPDWWGEIAARADPASTEDRYVAALEVKEVNDVDKGRQRTADRRRPLRVPSPDLQHAVGLDGRRRDSDPIGGAADDVRGWPVHEVGRNADFFDPKPARLLQGGLVHRVRLGAPALERPRHEVAPRDRLQVRAEGLQAGVQAARSCGLGNGVDIDIQADGSRTSSCTRTPCCRRTRRSSRSSRTCTRRARGCASRRSGATTSRR